MIEALSVVMLVGLASLAAGRGLMLRRRGIRVFLFGATDKSDLLLLPLVVCLVYIILSGALPLPMPEALKSRFWQMDVLRWAGLALCLMSLVWFALTLISFGSSFRVGIDRQAPDKLVTGGMFALSRNPIYVGFLSFLAGMFFVYPTAAVLMAALLFFAAIHRQVLREEKFLKEHYGEAYRAYCQKVRRYI